MPDQPTPSVGRVVHYVSYGTPGGEYTSQCRAAIVAGVPDVVAVGLRLRDVEPVARDRRRERAVPEVLRGADLTEASFYEADLARVRTDNTTKHQGMFQVRMRLRPRRIA